MKEELKALSRAYRAQYAKKKQEREKQEARIVGDYMSREMDKVAKYKHRKRRR